MKYTMLNSAVGPYPYPVPNLKNVVEVVEAFSAVQCQELLAELGAASWQSSALYTTDKGKMVDLSMRSSEWAAVSTQTYQKVVARLNFVVNYHLEVGELVLAEAVGFLRYDESFKGHFSTHSDSAFYGGKGEFILTSPHRKISTITYLNDDFEGGLIELENVRHENGAVFSHVLQPGSMLIFPSDTRYPHEVKPVTRGTRYSIVAWYDIKT